MKLSNSFNINTAVLLLLFVICCGVTTVHSDEVEHKNFTRSRYSRWHSTPGVPTAIPTPIALNNTSASSRNDLLKQKLLSLNVTNEVVTIEKQKCGERIGGAENHPWIAVLEHSDPLGRSRKKTLSKGVLIDAQHVLTTVSSIHNSHPFWTVSYVRLGDKPTRSGTANTSATIPQRIPVDAIYNHQLRDIAIVRLLHPVQISDAIMPICLPSEDVAPTSFSNPELHQCIRSTSRSSSTSSKVHQTRVTTIVVQPLAPNDCRILLSRKGGQLANDEMCAWDDPGDTCTRDLGGPLSVQINGRHHVVGLNSFVNFDSDIVPGDFPGIYTRVGAHLQWIQSVLELANGV